MGARKRNRAEKYKEERANNYFAILNDCPSSPRKMRLIADLIRGEEVNNALNILKFTPQHASRNLEKLLLSAISNWQNKNEGVRIEDSHLFVSEIKVDQGRTLKRFRPAPQGRAHRIRKRSNHVTLYLASANQKEETEKQTEK